MKPNGPETTPNCYSRLVGPIDEKSVKEVLKDIDGANNNDQKKLIILTLASSGGLLYYAQVLYDAIKASKKPIVCIVSGSCMSASLMILQAASKRISRPNTIFMLHQSTYWTEQHTYMDEINVMNKEWNRLYKQFVTQSISRSTITLEEFEKIAKPRKYFSAKEALDMKFIDTISDKWIDSY
ncbi:hypothetical protein A2446_06290 [Candidatus Roizmanbacteria bacterium RIFOXYC2_FULL_38_9]|uniref:ATP-dependent Clp protease proteolytic subunit n=1 Tax=Candidatus Roizmanbacteria bacterium RIFOXYD1_FULL_38_12 TaxID=1802093 RepID=A0A1F7L077_9BACT|nr:MAG: hypothetical protein A3K47_01745 [Candidatus Roizmanbacteria bacterium RIFOXYA2_FULL_38_14]OGK63505.1 MAG: hypothetical protein A3K27_01745 [Candidatus Roizmanbacteria bacterium RIFOXYA1_FULL_37_12]OGK65351.1 MAG: hypothetical protein A3K38_01745 [Candidatus Roizmanbacteria bacterium RIFOXYB1_FULL_40_23]OGK69756.1 MAG: hypothetical protein A3K21_01750 [Candidatus Roizmanbacteria bacterium RIFOXYC1_FULL_38_14]OGK72898.1 MAG: hypothetical protein A2446_06290 [Candidatus Roizmanbacteria ba